MNVYVVYYDEYYGGIGERGADQRKIEAVYDNVDAARAKCRELDKMAHIVYADFDVHELLMC